ncbi:M42 family metallopeptidase [Bacillus salitolerans]|uniref:M42 family metallopeptidase n=1 Tax=Bacillus salitolerans TaxID=1437434 RepID=A0ABW4LMJ6_9BACI
MKKMDKTLVMLKELTDAKGIPGNEGEVREVMKKFIEPFSHEVYTDGLGSLIAKKVGDEKGPKIMIAGHLDEVGFMITKIDERGFLLFEPIGSWWSQVLLAQRVTVVTKNGDVSGIIGSKPPHILSPEARKKPADIKDMFIDIGASSREEAMEFGVRPGDQVVPYFEFTVMNNENLLLAKAWDNRIGCAIAIEVLKQLKNVDHPNIVYGVGTAQEEVPVSRGAQTSAEMIKPDIAFSVDVGIASDTPGISGKEARSKMGEGPQIIIYDASMISHKELREFVVGIAEEFNIPYQYDYIPLGWTDSGAIHVTANGVPALSIAVPTRYIHTHAAMLHRADFENTVKLLVEIIKKLDLDKVREITFS